MLASNDGYLEIVRMMIGNGADVNAENNDGDTSLIMAFKNGHLEVAQLLIEKGADINAKGSDEQTPLMYAFIGGNLEMAKLLIGKGADVSTKGRDSQTPLMHAVNVGHLELVKLLIERGAEVNAKDNGGRTSLHYAALNEEDEMIEFLVKEGAEVVPVEETGEDIYATAISYRASAEYFGKRIDIVKAKERYIAASQYFEKASVQFKEKYKEISREKLAADTKDFLKILGAAVAQAALEVGAQQQARIQARQMAEIQALQIANKTGTGISGYYRAINAYKPWIRDAGKYANAPQVPISSMTDTSSLKELKQIYFELSEKSHLSSLECNRIAECYNNSLNDGELAKCKVEVPVK